MTEFDIQALADYLRGTCNSLEDGMRSCFLDSEKEEEICKALVDEIFMCDCCGWWCDNDELNNLTDQELCNDCLSECDCLDEDDDE